MASPLQEVALSFFVTSRSSNIFGRKFHLLSAKTLCDIDLFMAMMG